MANYGRELRMGGDIRKKGKVEKTTEFVERIKKVHEKAGAALKKTQKDIKRQADKGRKKTKDWKRGDKVLLSTKDLVFKERLASKKDWQGNWYINMSVHTQLRKWYPQMQSNCDCQPQ